MPVSDRQENAQHRRARELADAGAWPEVVSLLTPPPAVGEDDGDGSIGVLYAEALTRTGHEREACDWLRRIVPMLAEAADRGAYRRALNLLGVASFTLGELDEASDAFATTLELASRADDLLLVARAANNLGAIANLKGAHDAALGSYRLALPTFRRLGKRREIAETYHNLAVTFRDLGELEEADEHERRAIDYAAEGAAPRVAAMGRIGRAEIALRRGDPHFAEGTARHAARALHVLHDPLNEGDALRLLGTALAARGRYDEAHAAFAAALDRASERGHAILEGEIRRDRAFALLKQGDRERARAEAETALAIFTRLGATAEIRGLSSHFPPG